MEEIKATITRIIAEYLDKDASEISADARFTEIGLDSLDIMELVMQMQEELDCKIELTQEITTIEKLAEVVAEQKAES
ncbi:MAG: acyl carrier protein [Lachnospiraceae bacterium]|nr:acyl carrier protein [Lachnospiraceae bacterium]